MQKLIIACCALLSCLAIARGAEISTFKAPALCLGTVNPQLAEFLALNPDGGLGLENAIENSVVSHPPAADDAVYLAWSSQNLDVKQAIGAALARALAVFVRQGDLADAARIREVLRCADAITIAAFSYANARLLQAEATSTTTFGEAGATGSGCAPVTSPTRLGC
jgi:hypothetical protein